MLNSYHTIMIWLIDKHVIAPTTDSNLHLRMEIVLVNLHLKLEMVTYPYDTQAINLSFKGPGCSLVHDYADRISILRRRAISAMRGMQKNLRFVILGL